MAVPGRRTKGSSSAAAPELWSPFGVAFSVPGRELGPFRA